MAVPSGINYALVARGTTVLVDHTLASGNFAQVTHLILQRLTPGDQKQSYSYDKQVFHIHIAAGVTYLAMCEENFERRVAYAFLNEIRERFNRAYGQQAMTAMAYAMNKEFSKILGEQMKHFTSSPSADKVRKVQSEIDDVKQVMVQNVERLLERGEKIELLVNRAESLTEQSVLFHKNSTNLKRKMWWQNMKLNLVIFGILCVIILIILLVTKPWEKKGGDSSSASSLSNPFTLPFVAAAAAAVLLLQV